MGLALKIEEGEIDRCEGWYGEMWRSEAHEASCNRTFGITTPLYLLECFFKHDVSTSLRRFSLITRNIVVIGFIIKSTFMCYTCFNNENTTISEL
ncbi:hypothetical protein RJT34_20576 [Clitoria ternatea]|uniref:Uncharacterized protein n=1 Tax=Clitoria ternatea TaxID=43366 RepID=A0AAN9IT25_CLITE